MEEPESIAVESVQIKQLECAGAKQREESVQEAQVSHRSEWSEISNNNVDEELSNPELAAELVKRDKMEPNP